MDDIFSAGCTAPPLPAIRLERYNVGRRACTRLLELIVNQRAAGHAPTPFTLIRRASTGPVPRR